MANFPIDRFNGIETPFYYYDFDLLRSTLEAIKRESSKRKDYFVHYAIKANANRKVLEEIAKCGFGVDCVSGNEIKLALEAGFDSSKIVFAGVAKTDKEILIGIDNDIFCFNCESIEELQIIQELASQRGKVVRICLRINPDVAAHTHANITTGSAENKFGIPMSDMERVIKMTQTMENISFIGLHFHIGSQILDMEDFRALCVKVNELLDRLDAIGIEIKVVNVGGGLGIDYSLPDVNPIPDFESYFKTYSDLLKLRNGQELHFELGRAVVGQMGSLIAKTIFVKRGTAKDFLIVDAGMTELIRPALYGALHKVENISSKVDMLHTYDVVGPICESSDVFAKDYEMQESHRGDLIAFRSAGAYGMTMANQYNSRDLPKEIISDELV